MSAMAFALTSASFAEDIWPFFFASRALQSTLFT